MDALHAVARRVYGMAGALRPLCISSHQSRQNPGNDYLLISRVPAFAPLTHGETGDARLIRPRL